MNQRVFFWMALHLVPGVGSVLFKRLLDRFGEPEAVFEAPESALEAVDGVGGKVAGEIRKGPDGGRVERDWEALTRVGGKVVTLADESYPRRLREIYDPPPVLYLRGDLSPGDDLAVAIVGSRKTSPYGRAVTERISRDLAARSVTVVSGMARGIDSVAHSGALTAGGRTIAVLGCGVDVVYPPENRKLFCQIVEHGAVISEFPMGASPEAAHFPRRNRMISGLAIGIVVVEARAKSGSLITAACALEQGRDVFAVPGNIGDESSRGTNQLIKQGAKLVETSEDILSEILPQWAGGKSAGPEEGPVGPLPEGEEHQLFSLLGSGPRHIDSLIRESGLDPGKVSSLLLALELKGLVAQWPGKGFSRKI
jgi:DNA processing protein